jgi:hypothetical protein
VLRVNADGFCKSCILQVLLDPNYTISMTSQSIISHLVTNGSWSDVLPHLRHLLDSNVESHILSSLGAFDKICEDDSQALEQKNPVLCKSLLDWLINNMSNPSGKIRYVHWH